MSDSKHRVHTEYKIVLDSQGGLNPISVKQHANEPDAIRIEQDDDIICLPTGALHSLEFALRGVAAQIESQDDGE